ncbi:MAG: 16S rRNA (guanine(966)-N(2))-methyltransferase RsmD [Actinobacteria bacterium]|nr:16S rRNA (guanine(966)-N(2))-methyltransferase RsmD [Actinomycetota bacterium]MDQ3531027.1 16S rRNA (guanine(966)-N(2))-methyltransferase RsmD [Actinomycetota bacterium]
MRVTAGEAKGRRLKTVGMGTRPMTDRMKEALFSSLGDVTGATVLDLYAGSGALGLEALSRGADTATFVESARDAILKLEENVAVTGFGDRAQVLWADVESTLAQGAIERLDLIFIDPPYSMAKTGVQEDLEELVTGGFLADDGRIVVHRPARESGLKPLGLEVAWERAIGQSQLIVYRHEANEP